MIFVKNKDLKVGMRLAKPVYNKKGVLLYDRDTKLTAAGIEATVNFGLIGLYILEPAEPLPPMTEEDIEFERFQTVEVSLIDEELNKIFNTQKATKIHMISADIQKNYGHLNKKINFVQNLRSREDYVYKHALYCAMLCAMITHVLNVSVAEQNETVIAALVHDIGKLSAPKDMDATVIPAAYEREGFDIIDSAFSSMPNVKRAAVQCHKILNDFKDGKVDTTSKLVTSTRVLLVAETFDTMTAMNDYREPSSEIAALKYLQNHPEVYDPKVVAALVKSINFLTTGCCVELNNGEKGLVINGNDDDVLHPMVLCFSDNSIVDLRRQGVGGLEIKDVMKTMDNRCFVDKDMLSKVGAFGTDA